MCLGYTKSNGFKWDGAPIVFETAYTSLFGWRRVAAIYEGVFSSYLIVVTHLERGKILKLPTATVAEYIVIF